MEAIKALAEGRKVAAMPRTKSRTSTPREQSDIVADWLTEIAQAKKREKDFRKQGEHVLKLYECEKHTTTTFNILFSNTETLSPALYSASPRPLVERRYKDDDGLGLASSVAAERMLSFQLDTNIEGYETFDDIMKMAVLDGLLPGRAVSTVKYEAEFNSDREPSVPASNEDEYEGVVERHAEEDAPAVEADETDYLAKEQICLETKVWNRVYFGYAKKWSKVPWIAYEEYIDREEAVRLFGEEVASRMKFSSASDRSDDEYPKEKADKNQGLQKTACIYQIWDRDGGKKVRFISNGYAEGYLKVIDDPLQLTGFYNCPRPLQFIDKAHSLIPTAMYNVYEAQAMELNRLSLRITHITEAIKARGIYDGELGDDIANLMKADDNELVPAEKGASLAAEKGLDNAIWFMPIDKLVLVLQQLYQARETCKQVIFDITGIADIMRGSTKASETLGAQELKSSWGTLRIKNKQKEVQRYVRDLLRIMLEVAATKFDEETWAKMTGLPYLTTVQAEQLQMQMQAMQQQAMSQPQQPGQPPDGPPPEMQQIQQQLQQPTWGQVLGLLRDDMQRSYRIDIETDSTVEPDATNAQQDIMAVMAAMGQVMNGIGPLVLQGALPFQAAQTMLLTVVRAFKGGRPLEESIKQMQTPKPPDEGNDKAKAAEQAVAQAQQQLQAQQQQMQQQKSAMDLQVKTLQAEKDILEKRVDLELREIQLKSEQDQFELEKQAHEESEASSELSGGGETSAPRAPRQPRQQSQVLSQLAAMMASQAEQHAQSLQTLTQAMTAPKTKRAIRGLDGRIQAVTEEVSPGGPFAG